LALPKTLGGWGIKNIFLFSKALVAKAGWRLIRTPTLWSSIALCKYILLNSLEYWICPLIKPLQNVSIIWKEIVTSFQVISNGLTWRIGRGSRVILGVDPWPGSGLRHILPEPVIQRLDDHGFLFLCRLWTPLIQLSGGRHGNMLHRWG
jgi:hypothetical protein